VGQLLAFDVLTAFWCVAGLTAVQLSLVRAWQHDELAAARVPARYGICTTPSCMKMPRVFT